MHGSFQRKTAPTGAGEPLSICSPALADVQADHCIPWFCCCADSGTRPGLHGQTLISTGLVDWDRLLGGGLPLGTLSLIIQVG